VSIGHAIQARSRVLIVDDNPALRQLLEDILVLDGFDVLQTSTGVGLTELVRIEHPDLVLLDEMMEPVRGLDALQQLRAGGEQVPIVMVTADARVDMIEAALDAGADDYVAKPFTESILLAHIRAVLRRVDRN
jgi:DNA-binding response OmpR family regulator